MEIEKTIKHECTLTDKELIEKCEKWITKLCESGGRNWSLKVPVDFNNDPDMLFTELIKRFKVLKKYFEKDDK